MKEYFERNPCWRLHYALIFEVKGPSFCWIIFLFISHKVGLHYLQHNTVFDALYQYHHSGCGFGLLDLLSSDYIWRSLLELLHKFFLFWLTNLGLWTHAVLQSDQIFLFSLITGRLQKCWVCNRVSRFHLFSKFVSVKHDTAYLLYITYQYSTYFEFNV